MTTHRQDAPAKTRAIAVGARTIEYTVRRSSRAKRLQMRYLPGTGFEVVLPARLPLRVVEPFVRGAADWMLRVLGTTQAAAPVVAPDGFIRYLDERLRLQVAEGSRAGVERSGDTLIVTLRQGGNNTPHDAVEAWYRAEARRVLTERAAVHAATLGVRFGRIAIKDTRSRWGSCSSHGNLNFSWRLIMAPEAVLDYVVAHEVAHLREPNHSPRFWALVEQLCPAYRARRAWLREHGRELAAWPK